MFDCLINLQNAQTFNRKCMLCIQNVSKNVGPCNTHEPLIANDSLNKTYNELSDDLSYCNSLSRHLHWGFRKGFLETKACRFHLVKLHIMQYSLNFY